MFTPFAFVKPTAGAAPSPTLWTPANITTFYWIDAADSATLTLSGNNVSQWNDKSGNGFNATQATDGLRPLLTGSLNGLNIVYWDGSKKMALPDMPWGAKNISYYSVVNNTGKLAPNYGYSVNLIMKKTTGDSFASLSNGLNSGKFGWYTGGEILFPNSNDQTPQIQQSFAFISQNGVAADNSNTFWFNGNNKGTVTGLWNAAGAVFADAYLGNDQYGSSTFGNIAEIVVVNQVDSTAERQKMEGYLAWKWGLEANLPDDSPYKLSPPYA